MRGCYWFHEEEGSFWVLGQQTRTSGSEEEAKDDVVEEVKLQFDSVLSGFMESIHGEFTTLKSVLTSRVDALESSFNVKLTSLTLEVVTTTIETSATK